MPQDIASITQPPQVTEPSREQVAYQQYLQAQMNQFRINFRQIHAGLLIANANKELSDDFKKDLRAQMLQAASILEVE